MSGHRKPEDIDADLSLCVKRRKASRNEIARLSQTIVDDTKTIDKLVAERAELQYACPDSPEELTQTQ